jgi:hypothetical protein
MLPFAMRSAPIPAGVAGSASSALPATRAPQLAGRTSVPTRVVHRFAHPLFSYRYELLFPQLLCFDNHLRCPIVFLTLPRNSVSSANSVVNRPLTPVLTYSCGLFGVAKRVNSFAIKEIQTLFAKYPGWGYLIDSRLHTLRHSSFRRRAATWTRPAHPTIIAATFRFQVHG